VECILRLSYSHPATVQGLVTLYNPTGKNGFSQNKVLSQMLVSYLEGYDAADIEKLNEWRRKKKHKKGEVEPIPLQRGQKLVRTQGYASNRQKASQCKIP
jgi:hypothetical protein